MNDKHLRVGLPGRSVGALTQNRDGLVRWIPDEARDLDQEPKLGLDFLRTRGPRSHASELPLGELRNDRERGQHTTGSNGSAKRRAQRAKRCVYGAPSSRSGCVWDPQQTVRQDTYWSALRATGVEIIEGHFLEHQKMARVVAPPPTRVLVWKAEEKGSDVNLASYLLRDAFQRQAEQFLVISNDADLASPLRMVRDDLHLPVGVAFPISKPGRRRRMELVNSARFVREIRPAALAKAMLPDPVIARTRTLTKPARW